jgi:hypothetical protein
LELAQTAVDAAHKLPYAPAGSQRPVTPLEKPSTWHP